MLAFVDTKLQKQIQWGIRSQLLQKWAEADVASALNYATLLKTRTVREQCITTIMSAWAAKDPLAAVNFINKLPTGQNRTILLGNVMSTWCQEDPEAAAWIKSTDLPDAQKQKLLEEVAGKNKVLLTKQNECVSIYIFLFEDSGTHKPD